MNFPLSPPAPSGILQLAAGNHAVETRAGNRKAVGTIVYGANLSAGHTIVINGVTFSAVASGASGNQFNIGASLTATLDNIVTVLTASANAAVAKATYANTSGTTLTVTHKTYGVEGNTFTLAATGSGTVANATLINGASDNPISLDAETTLLVTSAGGNMDFVLPAGSTGQEKTLVFATKGGSANAVVAGTFAGGTAATFDAANDFLKLKWLTGAWRIITNSSVSIA